MDQFALGSRDEMLRGGLRGFEGNSSFEAETAFGSV